MFVHNFKYNFKVLFKNRSLIFWTFVFPLILGTFFNMAFSNIEKSESLDIINIAIVEDEELENDEIFKEAFDKLSDEENENRLFNIKYINENEAKDLLNNNEISGYLKLVNDEPKITVIKSGINETIFKYVTEEISMQIKMIKEIAENKIKSEMASGNIGVDFEKIYENALEITQKDESRINNISSNNLSYTMIEFYTLIAMACLYGGMLGMASINNNLANMSNKGKRVAISPIVKLKVITSSVLASYVVALIGIGLLFLYTILVLKVDYGSRTLLIIILAMLGSFSGLSIGIALGTCLKAKENVKEGLLIVVTMLGCFFSGMMGITMKYVIDTNIPLLNKINPANMITDGLYSLYYYDTLDRYYLNIFSLLAFAGVMIILSFISLRRQKYDSI